MQIRSPQSPTEQPSQVLYKLTRPFRPRQSFESANALKLQADASSMSVVLSSYIELHAHGKYTNLHACPVALRPLSLC